MPNAQRRTVLLIVLLGLYIVLRFAWWGVLLVRKEMALEQAGSPVAHVQRTVWMLVGEGTVFITLIGITLWLLYRGLKRELAASRLQRNFLLAASHELRTPIASLQLQLQTALRSGLSEEERHELHRLALNDVHRLGGLAEKVLLATRLEETSIPLDNSWYRLNDLVEEVCAQARASYAKDHRRSPTCGRLNCDRSAGLPQRAGEPAGERSEVQSRGPHHPRGPEPRWQHRAVARKR